MTVTRFQNAPLIEVIAELRWKTAQDALIEQVGPGFPIQIPDALGAANENFVARFAAMMDEQGFRSSERLVPYGTPSMPGQPTSRFRQRAMQPPIIQVGNGMFTANGLPPTYTHWGDFRPLLQEATQALLTSRDENESETPFALTVRYIDAFRQDLWLDKDAAHFVDEVLGFNSKLPEPLIGQVDDSRPRSTTHNFTIPLNNGSTLYINVGEGSVENEPAVILDFTTRIDDVRPELEAVMEAFERGHRTIRSLFVSMTGSIRELMEPVEVEER